MDIKKELYEMEATIDQTRKYIVDSVLETNEMRSNLNDISSRIDTLAKVTGANIPCLPPLQEMKIEEIDCAINSILLQSKKYKKIPKLSSTDIVVGSLTGIIAVAIDVFMVGTPEIVKIYKGGENFDGSILTKAIRKLGEGPLSNMYERLETICKVPYDISVVKSGMYPQNHRLRSLSHDPFFGLFFSIFDMIMNTTTFIDNSGFLRILPNTSYKMTKMKLLLSVFYFLGHIISDVFTVRGIPLPGFFMTQFFTSGNADKSISKIAEKMYLDGYDLRHFASMTTSVIVKKIIIDVYLKLSDKTVDISFLPLAEREKQVLNDVLIKEKICFIANSIAVSGNVVKFFAPPYSCNPCSINIPEWMEFIKSGVTMLQAQIRDSSAEEALANREDIDKNWEKLVYNL